jgi:hypothetical protein
MGWLGIFSAMQIIIISKAPPFFVGANVVEFDKLQRIGLKPNGIDFCLGKWI